MGKNPRVWNKHDRDIPADAVYVGRPSKWGNPFTHVPSKTPGIYTVKTRERAIACYEHYLTQHPSLIEEIKKKLKGKHLVCWCAPKPCHADILLRIANE